MKFTDYPKDLQRIVELTPEGVRADLIGIGLFDDDSVIFNYECDKDPEEYSRAEYNQCREAYQRQQWRNKATAKANDLPVEFVEESLAAMNEPVKPYVRRGDRVDCNCDQLRDALEDMLSGWRYIREVHGDLSGVGWDRAEDKARKALEKAK